MTGLAAVTGAVVASGATAYLLSTRLRRWGTRGDEATRPLPGEELVPGPAASLTQAVDIAAPPEQVWPWVAQLGQDKGGFYSYAWLENLGGARVTNADHLDPAWQQTQEGDRLRLHPRAALEVQRVVPGRLLVAGHHELLAGLGFQWVFLLTPDGPGRTRLLVRERYVVPLLLPRALAHLATVGSAVMSHRMLRGIRERAERQLTAGPGVPAAPR
ncbi:SRPBCC family protein [Ornithinimicrobium sediminis]|uniref:SRPBCC family protein n=1 Tax=Ornithinimicrobium sediminis TaxID=2904603 RepID=UPI001E4149A0|nr:SRPBCC family protein [Ornithinimicrobium sediminis]MCE0485949.1 SRPBCC family protein [Ornithinimicrobium sediminis]